IPASKSGPATSRNAGSVVSERPASGPLRSITQPSPGAAYRAAREPRAATHGCERVIRELASGARRRLERQNDVARVGRLLEQLDVEVGARRHPEALDGRDRIGLQLLLELGVGVRLVLNLLHQICFRRHESMPPLNEVLRHVRAGYL